MIPPEIMELSHTVREVLAERGPLTTAGIGVYLPGRQPDDIAAAVHVLKHADRIRRCGRREGRAVWSLSDRPAEAPPVRLSQASLRSLCRDRGDIDVMAEAVPADRYAYTSKRQRMLAEQYGVERIYCHHYSGDRLPGYIGRQMAEAGWRAVRIGTVGGDTGHRCLTVWGMVRIPISNSESY